MGSLPWGPEAHSPRRWRRRAGDLYIPPVLDDARIFHVNVNCADLARSRRFYVEGLGLTEGVRTAPAAAGSGDAFGLERAWWDAWILVGSKGFEGGAVDLLEWREPSPAGHAPANVYTRGFQ